MLNHNLRALIISLSLGVTLSACNTTSETAQNATSELNAQINVPILPTAAFFNESSISHVQLSSDSQWLAWLQNYNGIKNIYVMPTTGTIEDAYPLTTLSEPIDDFSWDIENLNLFYNQDIGGNENQQIFQIETTLKNNLAISKTIALTHKSETNYIFMGQNESDANKLAFAANHDSSSRIDVYELNLTTKKLTTKLVNNYGFQSFLRDEKGDIAVAVGGRGDGSYALYSGDNGEWKTVLTTKVGENINLIKFDSKSNKAYISSSLGELDKLSLIAVDLSTGQRTLIHQDPNNRSDVYATKFDDDAKLQMVSYYYGNKENHFFDKELESHWQHIRNQFDSQIEISILESNDETGTWLVSIESDIEIGKVFFYDTKTQKLKLMLNKDPLLKSEFLAKRQAISYQSRDGITIQAYLTLPHGNKTNLPTIILPHGGPWARDYWTLSSGYFNRVAQLLANRGYAVLQPNFRASTGFGEHFYNLGNHNWGTGYMQHDLTDGAKYLVAQGIADQNRLGILGGSYGGYAALSGVAFTPDLYRAAISFVGPSSLVTLINSFPDYYRPYLGNWYAAIGDPLIKEDVEEMKKRSPINFVDHIKTPLLLVQGANDPRVTQNESDQIAKKMYTKGLDVEYILAKDEGHGFSKRINNQAFLVKMEHFFAKHLGGKHSENIPLDVKQHLEKLNVDLSKL